MANVSRSDGQGNSAGTVGFDPTSARRAEMLDGVPAELQASSKYEFLGKLGEGGMGAVYKVRHTLMNKVLALKVMLPNVVGDAQTRARFLGEIRAVAQLDHKHVVPARDAEQMGEMLVLAMDFVDGISLDRLIKQKGPLPVAFACQCALQAAMGLQHAHEKGMVHRDIKPSNLMITRADKVVKILDFGLVQLPRDQGGSQARTQVQTFMGTPEYVSPEQAADARSADYRADIYSLGCTLYYMLAGRPPFTGDTLLATLLAHVEKEPPSLAVLPEGLWAVLSRMLAKKPEERYGSAREVAQALLPFTRAVINSSERVPPPLPVAPTDTQVIADLAVERASQPRRRQRQPVQVVWVMAGVLAAMLLLVVTGWLVLGGGGGAKAAPKASPKKEAMVRPTLPRQEEKKQKEPQVEPVLPQKEVVKQREQPAEPSPASEWTNSIGMKLKLIPAGQFRMGSVHGYSNEKPLRDVRISEAFYMGVHEVTQEQYEKVMGNNPSWFQAGKEGANKVRGMNTKHFPVENVSWVQAMEFCRKLSALDEKLPKGWVYRLPTEAQWEYACKGKAGYFTAYFFGNKLSIGQANINNPNMERPCAVGEYRANDFGMYDMHGNVAEWCLDWYAEKYYESRPNPDQDPSGPVRTTVKAQRGGSWADVDWNCRSATRRFRPPDFHNERYGFRLAVVSFEK